MPGSIKEFFRVFDGQQEVAIIDVLQTFKDQVSQAMPTNSLSAITSLFICLLLEAMHKDFSPQSPVTSQSNQGHTQITQRQLTPEFVHQAARTSSTI